MTYYNNIINNKQQVCKEWKIFLPPPKADLGMISKSSSSENRLKIKHIRNVFTVVAPEGKKGAFSHTQNILLAPSPCFNFKVSVSHF